MENPMRKRKKYVVRPGFVTYPDGVQYVPPLEIINLYGVCACECWVSYQDDRQWPQGYKGLIPLYPVEPGGQIPIADTLEAL
jgi:hypothetical protein